MHFNELIIRMRTQALGGLAAAGVAWAGVSANVAISSEEAAVGFLALLLLWCGIAAMDRCYYSRLLQGAVKELRAVEKRSQGRLWLSTRIERHCGKGECRGTVLFYGLPAVALVMAAVFAWIDQDNRCTEATASSTPHRAALLQNHHPRETAAQCL